MYAVIFRKKMICSSELKQALSQKLPADKIEAKCSSVTVDAHVFSDAREAEDVFIDEILTREDQDGELVLLRMPFAESGFAFKPIPAKMIVLKYSFNEKAFSFDASAPHAEYARNLIAQIQREMED